MIGNSSEGQTPIDDISGLRIKAQTKKALDQAEFENILNCANRYLLRTPGNTTAPFTYSWFLDVHKEMFGDVWEWAGKFRKTEKPVGVKAFKMGAEIHALISELAAWEKEKMQVDEIAVRLHHRLVWIHPFENGNGRWARLITNIYLRKKGLAIIKWPSDISDIRKKYIESLKQADLGDFNPLSKLQKQYRSQS